MFIQNGKEHLEHREYELGQGHSVRGVVLREIDGNDELEAGASARAKPALDDDEQARIIIHEQLRLSIVAVRRRAGGPWEPVRQPLDELDRWKTKTRILLSQAFQTMNLLTEKELADFHAGGRVVGAARTPAEQEPMDEVIEEADYKTRG